MELNVTETNQIGVASIKKQKYEYLDSPKEHDAFSIRRAMSNNTVIHFKTSAVYFKFTGSFSPWSLR